MSIENYNKVESIIIESGDLRALLRDNSQSPQVLSGLGSLINVKSAPAFDAYDQDTAGASAGINFEHIISGHSSPQNAFTPRQGRFDMYALPDGKSVLWKREANDEPWRIESTTKLTLTEPHYLDIEFSCRAHEPELFGPRGYAVLFWANYMNDVAEVPMNFRGIDQPGADEKWISADASEQHKDWNTGGTYRSIDAPDLQYDEDHNFTLNIWSYDYPRYTRPFYYSITQHGMVYMLMFDKSYTPEDEIRFSIFKFKLPKHPRPAWDHQYVIHNVETDTQYGYRMRAVWKKFVSAEDCLEEYERWCGEVLNKRKQPRITRGFITPSKDTPDPATAME